MTFSILPPPAPSPVVRASSPSSSLSLDSDGDADLTLPSKRSKTSQKAILTPGEVVTEDPQWM
ncbi:MAG: hypothetical protein Q9188_006304, partial [Gyalolechia gomerana]